MSIQVPSWDSDNEDQLQAITSSSNHNNEQLKNIQNQLTSKKNNTPNKDIKSIEQLLKISNNIEPQTQNTPKQIQKDDQTQQGQHWIDIKKLDNKDKDDKIYQQQKITYDKFVQDIQDNNHIMSKQSILTSNDHGWKSNANGDDGGGGAGGAGGRGFKKGGTVGEGNGGCQGNGERTFGGFKRFGGGGQNQDNNSNGECIGFGGRGTKSVGGVQKEGGLPISGGRGFGGFGGDSGGRGGMRGFGEDRNGGRFGGGFGQGGFQERGGRGRGGRGRGGFGRRDFGEGGFGGGGGGFRRDFHSQRTGFQTPQTIISEVEQPKQTFNIAELSLIQGIPKPPQKLSQQFRIGNTMSTQPLGLKCWPNIGIYIRKSKISLYLSRIHDHNCSILYFPYSNYTMDLYPGNMVNQFPFDYRKKLIQKNKPVGECYLQRCVGIKNFQIVAFAKICLDNLETTAQSIQNLFQQANRAQKQQLQSALIPYSLQLGSIQPIIKVCFDVLSKYDKFKEIIISTNNPKTFCQASNLFLCVIQELADNNDLVIQ